MFNKSFLLVVLFSAFMMAFFTVPTYADEAVIEFDNLNVRNGPGTGFDKITQVHKGDVYQIIQVKDDWVEIELDARKGWITKEYISVNTTPDESEESEETFEVSDSSLFITNDNTQIRKGPSTQHEIIGFLKKNAEYDIISEDHDWYEIEYEGNKGYIYKKLLTSKQRSSDFSLKNKVIVIDAGHGGHDVGSIGVSGNYEKDLTYKTAVELKEELTLLGAEVILTRENDEYIRLGSRSILANVLTTDAFISIHYNSFPEQSSVTGINSYYYHDQNKELASSIQQGIVDASEANDRGIAFGDFLVLRTNYKPSVLLELDFISNPEREQLLLTNAYQKRLVKGIINGLTHYFTQK